MLHEQSTSVVRVVQRQRNDEARTECFTKQTQLAKPVAARFQTNTTYGLVDDSYGPAQALRDMMDKPLTTKQSLPMACPHSCAYRPQGPQVQ